MKDPIEDAVVRLKDISESEKWVYASDLRKAEELILRVFKLIATSHFKDYKMSPHYCSPIQFDRSLGDDISDYVKKNYPDYYNKKENDLK